MSSMRARARPASGVRSLGSVAVALDPREEQDVHEQEEQRLAAGMHARRRRLPPPTCGSVALALGAALALALLAALLLGTEMDVWQQRKASRHFAEAATSPAGAAGASQLGGAADQAAAAQAVEAAQPTKPALRSDQSKQEAATEAERLVQQMQRHVAQHGPAGPFRPAGCRWRERRELAPCTGGCDPATVPKRGMAFGGFEAIWRCHGYEWWDEAQQVWTVDQPAACRLQSIGMDEWAAAIAQMKQGNASGLTRGHQFSTWAIQEAQPPDGSGTATVAPAGINSPPVQAPMPGLRSADIGTQVRCAPAYCVFRNLFYRGGRFYFVQDPASPTQLGFPWQLGRNRQGTTLSVADAAEFAASVQARVVPGETVLLDWVFFMHPTALGHWLEALMPLFRQVRGMDRAGIWQAIGGGHVAAVAQCCDFALLIALPTSGDQ